MRKPNLFKPISLTLIITWLIVFALLPILMVLITSFLKHNTNQLVVFKFTLENYSQLFDFIYFKIFLRSFIVAGLCTFLCLLFGYPFAFLIARMESRFKPLLLLLVIIPFWTSSLIRTYAMMILLKAHGIINKMLIALGIIDQPLQLLYTNTAVLIGLVYNLLPFMILPLYANIEKLNPLLIEAARDLGAKKITIFLKIILPLTLPGILAGILLVFLPAMTLFYIPILLGGAKSMLLGNLIQNQFLQINNWPFGSAISISLLILMVLIYFAYQRSSNNNTTKGPIKQELI
jgi:spermidine/putrescine transport system permease protein